MNKNGIIWGHILALFTSFIWGTTFISTKILLKEFQPVEILFIRFVLAIIILWIICPKQPQKTTKLQEVLFAVAGLTGICLYYLLENTALIYTLAANVGVIGCVSPLFTAIIVYLFYKDREKISVNFLIGFLLSIVGISFIMFNGMSIHLNPIGDMLAIIAALTWSVYSVLIKKLTNYGFSIIYITKKTFLYGIIFMIPFLCFSDCHLGLVRFLNPVNALNLLFLGCCASAICFASWSKAIKLLGTIKSSAYIYLIPFITIVAATLILKEPVSRFLIIGTFLTLGGLIISECDSDKNYYKN